MTIKKNDINKKEKKEISKTNKNIKEKTNRYGSCFVSPEGLHINILSDNDDYMTFITVKPRKL